MADIDYDALIAELEADRDEIDLAIQVLRRKAGRSQSSPLPSGKANGTSSVAGPLLMGTEYLQSDSFFGMSIPDATRKLLTMAKRKQSTKDIAAALERGGLHSTATNLYSTVAGVLGRIDRNGGDIVRIGKGEWGLAEWYPALRRKKRGQDTDIADLIGDSSDSEPSEE